MGRLSRSGTGQSKQAAQATPVAGPAALLRQKVRAPAPEIIELFAHCRMLPSMKPRLGALANTVTGSLSHRKPCQL